MLSTRSGHYGLHNQPENETNDECQRECASPERDRGSFRVFACLHEQPDALSLLRRIALVSLADINVIE